MKDKYNHTNLYYTVMALIMCISAGALTFAASYLQRKDTGITLACVTLCVLMMFVIMTYLKWQRIRSDFFDAKMANYLRLFGTFIIMYVVAFIMTFLPSQVRPVFIIGTVFALFTNIYEGMLFQIYFSILVTIVCSQSIETMIFYILSGIVGCLLSGFFMKKETFIYAAVALITVNISFSEILYYISTGSLTYKNILGAVLCTFMGLAIIMLLIPYIKLRIDTDDTKKLEKICDEEYELMVMLKEQLPDLYNHSMRVAKLAMIAAESVGADKNIVKAASIYQKIGRLEGKEYIKYGVEIAESYNFPRSVIDIIKQQNGRKSKPQSVEAAIVVMCDSVISAFEILDDKKNELAYDRELIVEQVINTKMEKDFFDESGITIKMYRDLKKCFKQEENVYDI